MSSDFPPVQLKVIGSFGGLAAPPLTCTTLDLLSTCTKQRWACSHCMLHAQWKPSGMAGSAANQGWLELPFPVGCGIFQFFLLVLEKNPDLSHLLVHLLVGFLHVPR